MMYPVRIYDDEGNLKKELSGKQVSKLHWKGFNFLTQQHTSAQRGINKEPHDLICATCGVEFKHNRKNVKACSVSCTKLYDKKYQKLLYARKKAAREARNENNS